MGCVHGMVGQSGPAADGSRPSIDDSGVPHSARMWNFWLGGKDHYAADRDAGEAVREIFPGVIDVATTSREFLRRAVRHLVLEEGVRQFLDIGTGLPTADNTHQIAQRAVPECRVVYVDNDPMVLAHARALLVGAPEGETAYLDADLLEPERILEQARDTLDFGEPIALILFGVVGHIPAHEQAVSIVRRLLDGLVSGSYFALYSGTDGDPALIAAEQRVADHGGEPYRLSSPEQMAELCAGLELLEPGLVPGPQWRPERPVANSSANVASLGCVARKP
jgi:hypothetical protein